MIRFVIKVNGPKKVVNLSILVNRIHKSEISDN